MINLRRATISDVEDLVRVHHAAVHGTASSTFYRQDILYSWSPSPTDQSRIDRHRQAIEDNDHLTIVAESVNNAVIVGFGSVIPSKQEIRAVYVDPTFAGQGIGSKILLNLEEIAQLHGVDKLHLDASLNAEKFYSHHGYSVVERGTHLLYCGVIMDCVKMSKDLQTQVLS
jgi:N-acetylglutamate synthase-like GNAT family acetyltransferase